MTDLEYAAEKYRAAAESLASCEGSLRDRLLNAFQSSASRVAHEYDGIPSELAARLQALHFGFTSREAEQGEGAIAASTRGLTQSEARLYAEEIVALAIELATAQESLGTPKYNGR